MEKETRNAIGKNIARLRKIRGLSQKELAEKIGIGLPNISYIENGKYAPRLNTLIHLSQVLGVEIYEFFVLERHLEKERIRKLLIEAIDKDENLLRSLYRVYLALKTDFSYHALSASELSSISKERKQKKSSAE